MCTYTNVYAYTHSMNIQHQSNVWTHQLMQCFVFVITSSCCTADTEDIKKYDQEKNDAAKKKTSSETQNMLFMKGCHFK